jgi:hypothetical protein
MARRDEEKKRRRQKRLGKRRDRIVSSEVAEALRGAERALRAMEAGMLAGTPATWPGACDASLSRPDMVKFELAMFATERQPGKSRFAALEERLKKGPLGDLPELDHWGMEEFFWHGVPGDSWHPVEAFLEHSGSRFPPAAQEQLRRFKEAQIGLFEVGEVAGDTVAMREWDPVRRTHVGEPFRAIALNIGGVNALKSECGKYNLTHVAPWCPEQGIYCGMGYGVFLDRRQTAMAADFLGFRHLGVAATPLPWNESRAAFKEHLHRWRQRDWQSWLAERLHFPFFASISGLPGAGIDVREVRELMPNTAEQARMFGIYFAVSSPDEEEAVLAGGTTVRPVDVTSANRMALAEYHAYRKEEGPPPGTVGTPGSWRMR